MLNHSIPYVVAATTSWLEFIIEVYFWPSLKGTLTILYIGIVLCVAGEIVRKLAIITGYDNSSRTLAPWRAHNEKFDFTQNINLPLHLKHNHLFSFIFNIEDLM